MGMTKEDDIKTKLLDELSKEPPMVLSTAYLYAKSYVDYGEDITKVWTTAVQQASIIEKVRQQAWVEAYNSFKKDYENRLKADMLAMLTDIQLEIEELDTPNNNGAYMDCSEIIQQKIDALRGKA